MIKKAKILAICIVFLSFPTNPIDRGKKCCIVRFFLFQSFLTVRKYTDYYLQENNTELTNTASNDHSDDKINICNIDRTTNIITG